MFVSCTVFLLSGRGLYDGSIPRTEESYRLWCVSECDQMKINNLDTYCEQVEEGRTTKRNKTHTHIEKHLAGSRQRMVVHFGVRRVANNSLQQNNNNFYEILYCSLRA
jgi:hypothetical protein